MRHSNVALSAVETGATNWEWSCSILGNHRGRCIKIALGAGNTPHGKVTFLVAVGEKHEIRPNHNVLWMAKVSRSYDKPTPLGLTKAVPILVSCKAF